MSTTTGGGGGGGGGGGYSSGKFVTEELLVKLNPLLEQLARQQPPINPSVDAYKRENDKVEYYLNELKRNPDDPYLRAQLHQAMDDKQHLYNLIQGNKNPFKTDSATASSTQTQPEKKSASTQSEVLKDMEKLKEMFKTPPPEKATFQGYKKKTLPRKLPYSSPPSYHSEDRRTRFQPDEAHLKVFESIPRPKPKPTPRYSDKYVYEQSTPHRKTGFQVPRRLVTGVKDWYS